MSSPPITIVVRLHAILQREMPKESNMQLEVSLAPHSTIADLIRHVPVSLDLDTILLVVNNQLVHLDHLLEDGDVVNLIPPVSGGRL